MIVRIKTMLFGLAAITVALASQTAIAQLVSKPEDVKWTTVTATFDAAQLPLGKWAKVVDDPKAANGKAVAVKVGEGRASHILAGGWAPLKTDAKYTAAFHLRMDMSITPDTDVAKVLYPGTESLAATFHMASPLRLEAVHRTWVDDASTETVLQWYLVDAPSQAAVKDYHDYVIRFERPLPGFVGFRVYWFGRAYCSVWVDRIRLLEEPLPSEAEALKDTKVEGIKIDHAAPATLVWAGPYNWTYRIPEVIGGKCELGAPPDNAIAFSKFDALLFSEVVLGSLEPKKRRLVSEFVKSGGGLVLLGGVHGYGKSHVHVSPLLADLLPVTTTGLWDLRQGPPGGWVVKPASDRFKQLKWDDVPRVFYHHEVALKDGAEVWLKGAATVDGKAVELPLLVARPFGKGWVVAFLGTPLGDTQSGQTPIWNWDDWGKLLTIVLNASRGMNDQQGLEKPSFKWDLAAKTPPPPAPQVKARLLSEPRVISDRFAIIKVWPTKLCFRPGEWGSGYVTLANGMGQPRTGQLKVSIRSGLGAQQPLIVTNITLNTSESRQVPVVWKIGETEEFGRELRADLVDADGKVTDSQGEYFTIGWNNYRLGQCRLIRPWTWDKDDKTMPAISPQDRWFGDHNEGSVPPIRRAYATVTEYFFWAPDDFGNLTPEEEHWFSGQAQYLISQADIHAVIDAAHDNGIAVVTYGKNWMGVAGLQVKRDGIELVRQHPEWCQWMVNGHPKWSFNVDQYRWGFDQQRELVQVKGRQDSGIGMVAVNCYVPECVQYGCEEIARSAKKYGWDGVRFDDHFTLETVFDGGVLFDGRAYENGEDFETLTKRNNRMTREITRANDPHFLLGFNYAGVYAERGIRHPEAFAETARDGGFIMLEWSSWWPEWLKTWGKVATVLSRENQFVHSLGGVAGMCPMGSKNSDPAQVSRWESAINYASQGHYYNVKDTPATIRNTRFMLRYGELLYGEEVKHAPDLEEAFKVDASGKVLWREFLHERKLDDTRRQISISLINIDPDGVINMMKLPPAPVDKATVAFSVPTGWQLSGAYLLDPDGDDSCVRLENAVAGGQFAVELRKIPCWNLLVLELSKQ